MFDKHHSIVASIAQRRKIPFAFVCRVLRRGAMPVICGPVERFAFNPGQEKCRKTLRVFRHFPSSQSTMGGSAPQTPENQPSPLSFLPVWQRLMAPSPIAVVEVQLAIDPAKRFTWPAYVAVTREEYRCPVDLLVIAPDPVVAKWCEEPIPLGVRRFVLEPPVLRREVIPKVTDAAEATRRPELALISAMAYGDSDEAVDIGKAALEGFSLLDKKLGAFYADLPYNAINEAARRALEAKVKGYVYTSPWILEPLQAGIRIARDEGRDEGIKLATRSLINMLRARGIDVPEQARQRILAERDIQRIEQWLERAVTAATLDEMFDEPN